MHYKHKLRFSVEGIDMEDIEAMARRKIVAYVGAIDYNHSQPLNINNVSPYVVTGDGQVSLWQADIEFLVVPNY